MPRRPEDLIRFNRDLLSIAQEECRKSELLRMQSQIDRIQRCFGIKRPPDWSLAMANWIAGVGKLPCYDMPAVSPP